MKRGSRGAPLCCVRPSVTDFVPQKAAAPPSRGDQIIFFSFHLAQMLLYRCSASLTAASGVRAPVTVFANIVFRTQVLNASSMAAVAYPGYPTLVAQSRTSEITLYLSGGCAFGSLA